ncbi:MAG: Transposase [Parcubacteria group bacterium GW2011_GWB1_57_6]|nr:MAG: Transposase [Parcubacteria group bacterium GW2011_GWA1_56_13]KKW46810.1 MAG: Transposase [Parcubacteria group bacterium GW2011_GWB1_57_6]
MNRKISFAEGEYYHVYSRGVEKRKIFLDGKDRERFQALLFLCNGSKPVVYRLIQGSTLYQTDVGEKIVAVGAYAFMPNHIHILVKEISENGITEFMRKVNTAYSMYFNKKYERVGPLFQGTFAAEHVTRDEHLKYLFAYIHLNIVKLIEPKWKEEGIKDLKKARGYLEAYPFSSYSSYTGKVRKEDTILSKNEFPKYFSHQHDFKDFVDEWLTFGPQNFDP